MTRAWITAALALVVSSACREKPPTPVDPAPPEAPPEAVGGGPTTSSVYSASSALGVLTSARCHRARVCGGADSECVNEAAAEHGDALARCDRGVLASALSDCALSVRSAACDAAIALPHACSAAALCVPR